MSNIRLKLTALTPLHIGSGEVYEPTNFIIDDNTLYEFRDEDFFMALPDIKREAFMSILNKNRADSFIQIHRFVKENREVAIKVASTMVKVTEGLQKEYDKKVGNISQIESKNIRVFNKFEIQKIQRKQIKTQADSYAHTGYIVGSSLKGAISTAYQEYIYKKDGATALKEKFQSVGKDITKNIFREFKVSDSFVTKISTQIGFALNKERFHYDYHNPQANIKLHTYIEVIDRDSTFEVDINYAKLDIREILESCNTHYMPIFKSIFASKLNSRDEYINEYLNADFYERYRHFELKPNQYLIRVGKHSGARAVTIDGIRDIKSKVSGGGRSKKPNRWEQLKEESTSWLFGESEKLNTNLLPFGWVLCEIIEESSPRGFEAVDRLHSLKIAKEQEKQIKQALKQKAKEQEEIKEQEAQAKREAKLASMTPIQRLIDTYDDIAKLINDMRAGAIEDLENIKIELAEEIKKELQKTPKTWDKAKKKALDRKIYIEEVLR